MRKLAEILAKLADVQVEVLTKVSKVSGSALADVLVEVLAKVSGLAISGQAKAKIISGLAFSELTKLTSELAVSGLGKN